MLGTDLTKQLSARTAALKEQDADATAARTAWRSAHTIRSNLRDVLNSMAAGLGRCMYCGDSEGTDIDHFKPLRHAPLQAFDWLNHLLACSHCNSNEKRDQYPCDNTGECLLIDPSREDPYEHLRLTLPTGQYTPLTPKGQVTLKVFGLSRPILERGRAMAYVRCKSMLRDLVRLRASGETSEASEVVQALRVQPFADVLYAMVRCVNAPGAATVLGPEVITALREWEPMFALPAIPAQRVDEDEVIPKGVTQ